jgi:hypothetical protein
MPAVQRMRLIGTPSLDTLLKVHVDRIALNVIRLHGADVSVIVVSVLALNVSISLPIWTAPR